ncbi:MAG: polyprenyl synthetase family protein [Chloroflexi bacterium]|nr:polyprenyl synthetase family protein [Chloroflexota bacterium]
MQPLAFVQLVQTELEQVEDLLAAQADGYHQDLQAALRHLLQAGGKRLRPVVALLMGRLLTAPIDRLIILAAALEMLHTATLVHDDLIDGALLRRGIPTLNARWSPAATVLTGDFLFARAAKLATDTGSLHVMDLFTRTLAVIVDGEIRQLFEGGAYTTLEQYERRIYAKTASMFELATAAAASLAGYPPDHGPYETARRYGYHIGMAFQIIDDILDYVGDSRHVGKPVGNDLRNGLITLPALYYLEEHPDDPDLRFVLEEGNLFDEARLQALVERIRSSGAIARAAEQARAHVAQALAALEALPASPEREALAELARYVTERTF